MEDLKKELDNMYDKAFMRIEIDLLKVKTSLMIER